MKIGYFGKLPVFADFIKLNSEGLDGLDNWIQSGLLYAEQKMKGSDVFMNMADTAFLFNEGNVCVSGAWSASRDASGRQYPFILFNTDKSYGSTDKFIADSDRLLGQINNIKQLNSIDEINNGLSVIDDCCFEHDIDYSNGQFWESTLSEFKHKKKYFIIQQLIELFSPFKQKHPKGLKLGIKLPLPEKSNKLKKNAISSWVKIIQAITGRTTFVPNLFWGENSSLYLYPSNPGNNGFLSIIKHDYIHDDIFSPAVDGEKYIDKVVSRMDEGIKSRLDDRECTITEII